MSNGARFDSLLVRHLAEELDRLLRGRSIRLRGLSAAAHGVRLDIAAGESLHFDLHPATRGVRREPEAGAAAGGHRLRVERVHAPPDERVLRFELVGGNRFREESRALLVELIPTRENAYELDGEGRVLQLLRSLHDPVRRLVPGSVYSPPPPTSRFLPRAPDEESLESALQVWTEHLIPLAAGERRAAFLSGFAYAGPLNAAWVLGRAATPDAPARALDEAFARWWDLVHAPARPHLVATSGGMQPYPHPLAGTSVEPLDSLLEGFTRAAASRASPDAAPTPSPELVERAEKRLAAARRRHRRLLDERKRAEDADALRRKADLLLAHLHRVERGAERAVLPGWEGGEVEIALHPQRTPAENAELLYAEARRRDRAQARLPSLIQAAESEIERRERELAAAREGKGDAEPGRGAGKRKRGVPVQDDEGLPYRSYLTSGGLEVRVGRNARANDRLTFGHSDPRDVWMHARSVGGSHVILRWPRDESPPSRDLEEAAVLAALHSKARGSGVVAVDWTQRRHVRKPRGAPPGAVTPGRTRTVFVAPDAAVEERMRRGDE